MQIGILFGLLLSSTQLFALERTSCGGDGPQPFTSNGSLKVQFNRLPTRGSVKDFVYRPRSASIFYRNQASWAYTLSNGFNKLFDFVPQPLSQILGKWERYHLAHEPGSSISSVIDTFAGQRYRTYVPKGARPLYWARRLLFWSVEKQFSPTRSGMEFLYQYPHSQYAQTLCTVHWPTNQKYRVASGGEYPTVLLYHTVPVGSGEQLSFYQVDLRKCKVTGIKAYKDPTSGPVQSVHYFSNPGGWAVQMDHPLNNLLWDNGAQCRYYNLGNQAVMPLHTARPLVATWSGRDGLTFWELDRQHKLGILPPGFDPVEPGDIAYDPARQDLYVRAAPHGTGDYRLLHAKVAAALQ